MNSGYFLCIYCAFSSKTIHNIDVVFFIFLYLANICLCVIF